MRLCLFTAHYCFLCSYYFFPLVRITNAAVTGSKPGPRFSLLQSIKARHWVCSGAAGGAAGGGVLPFWGLQSDYVLLSLPLIDGSHRNAVKIIWEIY